MTNRPDSTRWSFTAILMSGRLRSSEIPLRSVAGSRDWAMTSRTKVGSNMIPQNSVTPIAVAASFRHIGRGTHSLSPMRASDTTGRGRTNAAGARDISSSVSPLRPRVENRATHRFRSVHAAGRSLSPQFTAASVAFVQTNPDPSVGQTPPCGAPHNGLKYARPCL